MDYQTWSTVLNLRQRRRISTRLLFYNRCDLTLTALRSCADVFLSLTIILAARRTVVANFLRAASIHSLCFGLSKRTTHSHRCLTMKSTTENIHAGYADESARLIVSVTSFLSAAFAVCARLKPYSSVSEPYRLLGRLHLANIRRWQMLLKFGNLH